MPAEVRIVGAVEEGVEQFRRFTAIDYSEILVRSCTALA
jgi:hypothetical protein